MASSWLIQDKQGEYLGEAKAISPKVAFVLFMSDKGRSIDLADIETEKLDDGRVRVTYGRKVHFLKKPDE